MPQSLHTDPIPTTPQPTSVLLLPLVKGRLGGVGAGVGCNGATRRKLVTHPTPS